MKKLFLDLVYSCVIIAILSAGLLMCTSCGASAEYKKSGTSEEKYTATIEYPLCYNPVFNTAELILECIKACNTASINGDVVDIQAILQKKQP
jgi:hypothetical protein